jgi:hypothetical protein
VCLLQPEDGEEHVAQGPDIQEQILFVILMVIQPLFLYMTTFQTCLFKLNLHNLEKQAMISFSLHLMEMMITQALVTTMLLTITDTQPLGT